jgi:Domain of Unknown Function (DUF1080)
MNVLQRRRRLCASALLLAASTAAGGCSAAAKPAPAEGWTTLLDASSLGRWRRVGDANWRVVEGVVQADRGNGYLVSPGSFTDLELRAEFWVDEKANSGVFLRCQDPENITPSNSYEVNIWDTSPNEGFGTGSIVTLAKTPFAFKAAGRWSTLAVHARGPLLAIVLNGVPTVTLHDKQHAQGLIAVQYAGGLVRFRKLEVRAL